MAEILLITAEGILKKDIKNRGNAVRTALIRVILPAIEIFLWFHLLSFASILVIIGSLSFKGNSFGEVIQKGGRLLGYLGVFAALLKIREVWGLKILKPSIKPSFSNGNGCCSTKLINSGTVFWYLNTMAGGDWAGDLQSIPFLLGGLT